MIDLLHSMDGEDGGEDGEGAGGGGRRKRRCVDLTAEFTELEAAIAKNIDLKVLLRA
jgi:hypothetical protein